MVHLKRWGRNEEGTAIAELALVLPLLLVLLLGMLDFGKAMNEWIDQTHLANEGARLAAVNYCPDTTSADCGWAAKGCPVTGRSECIAWYVGKQAEVGELKPSGSSCPSGPTCPGRAKTRYAPAQNAQQVCVSYPNGSTTRVGDPVEVTVRVRYQWLGYLTSRVSLASTPIMGKAIMRLESQPPATSTACWPAGSVAGT